MCAAAALVDRDGVDRIIGFAGAGEFHPGPVVAAVHAGDVPVGWFGLPSG